MPQRNGGLWTESRFHSFIKSALRSASNRWPPKFAVKKAARVARGIYLCAGYNRCPHEVPASYIDNNGKRKDNCAIDHILPVVDPVKGFTSWDDLIERLFCEADGMQLLCHECHSLKTADERQIRKGNK